MTSSQFEHACRLRLRGASYRKISKILGVPRSTLHYHLKRKVGTDAAIRQGSLAVIEEYLNSNLLKPHQKAEVRQWLTKHSRRIIQIDEGKTTRLLTLKAEARLTREECGSTLDYRHTLGECGHAA